MVNSKPLDCELWSLGFKFGQVFVTCFGNDCCNSGMSHESSKKTWKKKIVKTDGPATKHVASVCGNVSTCVSSWALGAKSRKQTSVNLCCNEDQKKLQHVLGMLQHPSKIHHAEPTFFGEPL